MAVHEHAKHVSVTFHKHAKHASVDFLDAERLNMVKDKRKYKDRREYLIKAVYARRKKVRALAVDYKGGKCEICGYDRCIEALEFHHVDPAQKDFNISSKGHTRSWDRVKIELDKCQMLCANCHRELHSKLAASNGNVRVKKQAKSGKSESIKKGAHRES